MPGWLKALLIVAIISVLLIIGVVGAGVFWWMKNKDALMARAKEVVAEGKDFGGHSDNQGCVDEKHLALQKRPVFFECTFQQHFHAHLFGREPRDAGLLR